MREPRCETCDFFDAAYGECRRMPPTVMVLRTPKTPGEWGDDVRHVTTWPDVEPDQWCGEYRHTPEVGDA